MLLLDAGALIALERGDVRIHRLVKLERLQRKYPVTHGGVVGQVWRGGRAQARLAHALKNVRVVALDDVVGRRAGHLLALTGGVDVIDAALIGLALDADEIVTSDPDDLRPLAEAAGVQVDLIPI